MQEPGTGSGKAGRGVRAPRTIRGDPAFAEAGYALRSLRGLDLFPMTHHVECVAVFERAATR